MPQSKAPLFIREPAPPVGATRQIVIVGAGGFGREVLQYVRDAMEFQDGYVVKGFLDDASPEIDIEPYGLGVPVLGATERYDFAPSDRVIIAIGDPSTRLRIADRLEGLGVSFVTLVHPLAYVSPAATPRGRLHRRPFRERRCARAPRRPLGAHVLRVGRPRYPDRPCLRVLSTCGRERRVGPG